MTMNKKFFDLSDHHPSLFDTRDNKTNLETESVRDKRTQIPEEIETGKIPTSMPQSRIRTKRVS